MFVRRRFCSFGGSAATGAVSELRVGAAGAGALPAAILEGAFPPRWCFLQSFGGGCSRCCLSPSLSLPSGFFFSSSSLFWQKGGEKGKKKKKTSSFVGCRKASWDSWPARAGKRESGRGETNLCPACLARGLRAPNGHLRAPSPSDPISHWRCGNWEGNGSGVQGTAMRASPSAVRPAGLSLCPAARGRRAGWRANNQLVPMAQRLFSASQVCKTVREQTHCPGRSGPVPGGLLWGLAGTAQHFWGWP